MSVKFGDNSHELTCDFCNRRPEFYFGDWKMAWATAKADGWRTQKEEDGTWVHTCPDCAEDKT